MEHVKENIWSYGAEERKRWKGVHKKDFNEVLKFVKDVFGYAEEVWQEEQDRISHYSGAFLTKRECKKHIEANRHHYCEPHTFAMTALRNYEYERLLNILKTMSLEDTTIKE